MKNFNPTALITWMMLGVIAPVASSAPVINAVYTSYSSTGVPTSISITGTGLCAANTCPTKPTVKLGGVTLAGVTGTSSTGVSARLGLISDGDYMLTLTAGTSSTTFPLGVRAKTIATSATTVTAGTTSTLAAGQSATVINSGSTTAAVLNFGIPRGEAGAKGDPGIPGPQGTQGLQGTTGPAGPAGQIGPQGAKGDPGNSGTLPAGNTTGTILYWTGTQWAQVAPPTVSYNVPLFFCDGTPHWGPSCPRAIPPGSIRDCDDCPPLVLIPSGTFTMGSALVPNESPAHQVTLSSFYAGRTEVTQGEWAAIMGTNPSAASSCGLDCPVEQVSWYEAKIYAQKLSEKTGRKYRLLTEAEWEYSARAGTTTKWHFAENPAALGDYAWYYINSGNTTHPVAGKLPNQFGLYDMLGNVTEWVEDITHDDYTGAPTDGSAWINGSSPYAVMRGGNHSFSEEQTRSSFRWLGYDRNNHTYLFGVRIARDL